MSLAPDDCVGVVRPAPRAIGQEIIHVAVILKALRRARGGPARRPRRRLRWRRPQREMTNDGPRAAGRTFRRFAHKTALCTGDPAAFWIAIGVVVVWAISGPFFHFNDTWQLTINTGTTIVTFLMVFLIQNTQNRDSQVVHSSWTS